METNYRKQLKEALPHGSCKEIAEKLGMSQASISKYFNGKSNNIRTEKEILRVIGQHKKELEQLRAKAGVL